MGDENQKPVPKDSILQALLSNTEILTTLNSTVQSVREDQSATREQARISRNGLNAKLENLDRSVGEMKLASEQAETSRQGELKRIFDMLGEERNDRRDAVSDSREDTTNERDFIRKIIQEEMGERRLDRVAEKVAVKENKALAVRAAEAVWEKGGQYIVAAMALLVVAAVMKLTGISLADVIGLVGK